MGPALFFNAITFRSTHQCPIPVLQQPAFPKKNRGKFYRQTAKGKRVKEGSKEISDVVQANANVPRAGLNEFVSPRNRP
jgi:hypothetical protein